MERASALNETVLHFFRTSNLPSYTIRWEFRRAYWEENICGGGEKNEENCILAKDCFGRSVRTVKKGWLNELLFWKCQLGMYMRSPSINLNILSEVAYRLITDQTNWGGTFPPFVVHGSLFLHWTPNYYKATTDSFVQGNGNFFQKE